MSKIIVCSELWQKLYLKLDRIFESYKVMFHYNQIMYLYMYIHIQYIALLLCINYTVLWIWKKHLHSMLLKCLGLFICYYHVIAIQFFFIALIIFGVLSKQLKSTCTVLVFFLKNFLHWVSNWKVPCSISTRARKFTPEHYPEHLDHNQFRKVSFSKCSYRECNSSPANPAPTFEVIGHLIIVVGSLLCSCCSISCCKRHECSISVLPRQHSMIHKTATEPRTYHDV